VTFCGTMSPFGAAHGREGVAILWDRMPYLTALLNTEVIPLEKALEAYKVFREGSPKKFVIDPHNMTKLAG
jgi:glutathione-independent formaldehyde dehydrogenase